MFGRSRQVPPASETLAAEGLQYIDGLFATALRLTRNRSDAEDLVQDTYVKALRFADRFERGTNLRAWLFQVLDLLRPRAKKLGDFLSVGRFFFTETVEYDEAAVAKHLQSGDVAGHFGALDAGLPASGIGHVRDQAARGQAALRERGRDERGEGVLEFAQFEHERVVLGVGDLRIVLPVVEVVVVPDANPKVVEARRDLVEHTSSYLHGLESSGDSALLLDIAAGEQVATHQSSECPRRRCFQKGKPFALHGTLHSETRSPPTC